MISLKLTVRDVGNTCVLRFTKHCKDMLQEILMILMSLRFVPIEYICAN